eukprot:7100544-Prymnesium_polylepis.1
MLRVRALAFLRRLLPPCPSAGSGRGVAAAHLPDPAAEDGAAHPLLSPQGLAQEGYRLHHLHSSKVADPDARKGATSPPLPALTPGVGPLTVKARRSAMLGKVRRRAESRQAPSGLTRS